MSLPGFPCVMLFSTYRNVKREWFQHMSLPGLPSVMSLYLSQRGKGVVFVCAWFSLCQVVLHITKWKGGGFTVCLYLAFPLSRLSTYRKVQKASFNECLYLASLCHAFLPITL